MPEMDRALTPATIRGLRRRLGLTQAELAARLGCSTQAVSFWERGTRAPTGLYAREVRRLLTAANQADAEQADGERGATPAPAGTPAAPPPAR